MKEAIKLRMIFMGTSKFARAILASLLEAKYNLVAVFTRPDAPQGRKQTLVKSPVKELAESRKIPVFEPIKFDAETIDKVRALKPDIIIVAAYGKILPEDILKQPGFGCLNIHASLLPKYRGPSPIQNAILNGEEESGVTIFLMDKGIDTGKIIALEKIKINPSDNTLTLSEKMSKLASDLLLKTIPYWVEKEIEAVAQDDSQATICQLIEREDGRIIWEDEARNIFNKYRAFYKWPGIFCYRQLSDGSYERLKLTKIDLINNDPQAKHEVGEVFQIGEKIAVQTAKGLILIDEIQAEGKKAMSIQEYLNGNPNFVGSILR